MTHSTYRIVLGAVLLLALYFRLDSVVYAIVAMTLFEGVTGWTAPQVFNRVRGDHDFTKASSCETSSIQTTVRGRYDAERAWRFVVGGILFITYFLPNSAVWFFPWFMGFALIGAGASSVCPMLVAIRWLGFK